MKEKGANVGFIRMLVLLLMVSLLLCALAACGAGASSPVGKWYNEKGKCLDIRKDGSWKLEDSYGTGTWKKLDDGIFEFTDFYGDTQESAINEDESGQYIDFGYYGDFYRDAYPAGDATETGKANMAITIDPFENLTYEVSGISPYCKVSINNSKCSNEVQKYVTYTMDKETYANGDTVVVTAELASNTGELRYKLSREESEYGISNQQEYATFPEQIDVEFVKGEVKDKVTALISAEIGTTKALDMYYSEYLDTSPVADDNFYNLQGITEILETYETAYFSCLKGQKKDVFGSKNPYNRYTFIYCFDISEKINDAICKGKVYVTISAENIVCLADGSINWDNGNCGLKVLATTGGIDNCVSTTIMKYADNYNISKVDLSVSQSEPSNADVSSASQETESNRYITRQTSQQQKGDSQDQSTPHLHKYIVDKKISATCTAEGYTVYRCSCGASYNGNKANKLGHSYKNTVIAATTNSQGYALHTCTRCGHSYKDSYTEKITKPSTAIPGDSSEKEIIEDPIDFDDLIGNG